MFRIQQELKTLFEMEKNIPEEFKVYELGRSLSSFVTQWVVKFLNSLLALRNCV